jgi:hypothetical protein
LRQSPFVTRPLAPARISPSGGAATRQNRCLHLVQPAVQAGSSLVPIPPTVLAATAPLAQQRIVHSHGATIAQRAEVPVG